MKMAIRHVGFAVQDANGDVFCPETFADEEEKKIVLQETKCIARDRNRAWPEYSPHTVVRVLIDDGAEG
jgi:hypothetical protein